MDILNEVDTDKQAEIIDAFMKFCYCFPLDIEDRLKAKFGESMGEHFYKKYRGNCERRENSFVAMIYTVGDMTTNNKALFVEMIQEYYNK